MIPWLWISPALAVSWCAAPLIVHEWGVAVLRTDGVEAVGAPIPSWFHTEAPPPAVVETAVRHLPPDSGIRTLPVVQLYAPPMWSDPVPVALEVGFTQGSASVWYPQVDEHRPAAEANGAIASAARARLVAQRAERIPYRPQTLPPLPPDPTRQLAWHALTLQRTPTAPVHPARLGWVQALRETPGSLWIEQGGVSERFLFYEADTREIPALRLSRAPRSGADRALVVRNRSDWIVHDVIVASGGRVATLPAVPAGATATIHLDTPLDRDALLDWLRHRWIDPDQPGPPTDHHTALDPCEMMRDPAVPLERSDTHRLYEAELEVLLSVWADRLLEASDTHLVYREDTAALDAAMPLSLYTDMYHFMQLSRLGVVLVEGLQLP
ncbi:MAG TPA: hypothetical protein ENK18_11225 [Deltaproteobacteria bacterium]|nr:hypothetical protein [Deltaproteobacteria bacterium]